MYELIYRQNYPRPPAYLGMNLSVRGRRIFKVRSKSKKEKENNETKYNKREIIKAEYQDTALALKQVPKILSPDLYKGPVIEDLIEEIHHNYYNCGEHGVDFVPAVPPSPPAKKKSPMKHDRVVRSCYAATKIKQNSLCRKSNVKESSKKPQKNEAKLKKTDVGLFDGEWNTTRKLASDEASEAQKIGLAWERDTATILRDRYLININTFNDDQGKPNKSITKSQDCLSSLSLCSLLPEIKVSRIKSDNSLAFCDKLFTHGKNSNKKCVFKRKVSLPSAVQ